MQETGSRSTWWMKRMGSFRYAFSGLNILIREQPNARIHLIAAILVVSISIILKISQWEWFMVIMCIALVFIAEAFNTSIEYLADYVSTKHHYLIKKAKDVAAGAVLIAAIFSFITGLIIFLPKIISLTNFLK